MRTTTKQLVRQSKREDIMAILDIREAVRRGSLPVVFAPKEVSLQIGIKNAGDLLWRYKGKAFERIERGKYNLRSTTDSRMLEDLTWALRKFAGHACSAEEIVDLLIREGRREYDSHLG